MSYLSDTTEPIGTQPIVSTIPVPTQSMGVVDLPSMPGGIFGWAALGAVAWYLMSKKRKRERQREYDAGKARIRREYEANLRRRGYEEEREQLGLRRKR